MGFLWPGDGAKRTGNFYACPEAQLWDRQVYPSSIGSDDYVGYWITHVIWNMAQC